MPSSAFLYFLELLVKFLLEMLNSGLTFLRKVVELL